MCTWLCVFVHSVYMCTHTDIPRCKREETPCLAKPGRVLRDHITIAFILPTEPSDLGKALTYIHSAPTEEWLTGFWGPTYSREWFQNTQTGLLRSSVSNRENSTRIGLCRELGSGVPSLYTIALTTGVLITGRLGSLVEREDHRNKHNQFTVHESLSPDTMKTQSKEQPIHRPRTQITGHRSPHCPLGWGRGLDCNAGILSAGRVATSRERGLWTL